MNPRKYQNEGAGRIALPVIGGVVKAVPITLLMAALAMPMPASAGCLSHSPPHTEKPSQTEKPPAEAANRVAPAGVDAAARSFVTVRAGAQVNYPSGWEPAAHRDFALMLLPANPPAPSAGAATKLRWGERFISLDVPRLPAFRIPGLLPMNRVRGGYLDDLRKQIKNPKVEDLECPPIPDAQAVLVRASWPTERPTHVELALILTHADRVYIVRGRSRIADESETRAAFDQVVKSLRWSGSKI